MWQSGADADFIDAGVGPLAPGELSFFVELGLLGPGMPGPVRVDGQPPGGRH
jgi:hypothetical protein